MDDSSVDGSFEASDKQMSDTVPSDASIPAQSAESTTNDNRKSVDSNPNIESDVEGPTADDDLWLSELVETEMLGGDDELEDLASTIVDCSIETSKDTDTIQNDDRVHAEANEGEGVDEDPLGGQGDDHEEHGEEDDSNLMHDSPSDPPGLPSQIGDPTIFDDDDTVVPQGQEQDASATTVLEDKGSSGKNPGGKQENRITDPSGASATAEDDVIEVNEESSENVKSLLEDEAKNSRKQQDDSDLEEIVTLDDEDSLQANVGSLEGKVTSSFDDCDEDDKKDDSNHSKEDQSDLRCLEELSKGVEIEKCGGAKGSDDEESEMPMIRMNSSIFEAQNDEDEEEDDEGMDPEAIQSMMEVEMGEGTSDDLNKTSKGEESSPRRTPRRQAALIASNTIKEISNLEQGRASPKGTFQGRRKDDDVEYVQSVTRTDRPTSAERRSSTIDKQRCHQCKALSAAMVVVRQHGTDIHLCSNNCFNTFRNPDPTFRSLPCARCGALSIATDSSKQFFWETMNFCSDSCVGNYQLQVGSVCSTCTKKTPWSCMGKYCVRFGSDIRQFCTAACLETYKRNARVCFHCQLDIKKLSNVVLANIPFKSSPKEFCSQECVEQYIDQNNGGTPRVKSATMILCHVCKIYKELFKELVTSIMSYKVCSTACWDTLKSQQLILTATKCESCTKFINMDTISISPTFYVSEEKKAHGFCSPTCKNVFVLKTRQIRPCTTCQVKKYNYDLIQYTGGQGSQAFAVCSLNCVPKPSPFIQSLKTRLSDPNYINSPSSTIPPIQPSQPLTIRYEDSLPSLTPSSANVETYTIDLTNGQTELNYETGLMNEVTQIQIDGVSSLADGGTVVMNGDGTYRFEAAEATQYYIAPAQVSMHENGFPGRGMTESELMELQNGGMVQLEDEEMGSDGLGIEGEDVDLEDERWGECEDFVVIRHPEPVERRNKACQVKPFPNVVETQTDASELADMPRIQPKVKVLIVPVPVFIPFPVYCATQPVPVPYPIGIPVPIPVPIIFNKGSGAVGIIEEPFDSSPLTPIPTAEETGRDDPVHDPHHLRGTPPPCPVTSHPDLDGITVQDEDSVELMSDSAMSPLTAIPKAKDDLANSAGVPADDCVEVMEDGGDIELMDTSEPPETDTAQIEARMDSGPLDENSREIGDASSAESTEMENVSLSVQSKVNEGKTNTGNTPISFAFATSNSPLSNSSFMASGSPIPASPSFAGRRGNRAEYGLRAWKLFFGDEDPASLPPEILSEKLNDWTLRGTKPKGDQYEPDTLFYFFLGIQNHIRAAGRPDQLFYETIYTPFLVSLTAYAEQEMSKGRCIAKVEEDHVWECNELGPICPGVLLFTLIYYIYKYFGLKTWEEHAALDFSQVIIKERKNSLDDTVERYVTITGITNGEDELIEVSEQAENPFRCMVKLLEFYSSKSECSEGSFYKSIKPNHEPRAVWYCLNPLGQMDLYRMLVRAQMISTNF